MTILITIVHIIVCFVLILVILLQAGRGQGLTGASFSSGNVQSLFGTKAADFLTKATTVSAIGFMLTCLALDFIEVQKSRSLFSVKQQATQPIDLEQIKKALEKVKSEADAQKAVAETAGEVSKSVEGADAAAVPSVSAEVKDGAEKAAAEAETAVKDAAAGAPQ
jgi:preprotein translocase subunit SecG